ncbi:Transglutaminase elicitor [Phytophthora infestans]|nr:Transglutaminase elicitor [Phytophthora infestans]
MVYSPSTYLVSAAVAAVALQMQRTSAASLFYEPFTVSDTVNKISRGFPGFGAEVADQSCAIEVETDPTLPKVSTISTVPVTFTDLLANASGVPAEPIFMRVGKQITSEETPATDANQDAYIGLATSWIGSGTSSKTGTGVVETNRGTGWNGKGTTRELLESAVAGREKDQPRPTRRPSPQPTPSLPRNLLESAVAGREKDQPRPTRRPSPQPTPSLPRNLLESAVAGREKDQPRPTRRPNPQPTLSPLRNLLESAVAGRDKDQPRPTQHPTGRRLEENTNKDIAKLEAFYGTKMEMFLAELPTEGVQTPSPWAGPYWPTFQDSINVVWSEGQPSPAEKYATAFGLDATDFMNKVSKVNGVDSQSQRRSCQSDQSCETGSKCAIRAGKTSGYCIPTWFGICHAWAPAAILEVEPKCPVMHNGVTFQPMDIKALVSNVYDGAGVETVFTGARYNGGDDATDAYGRHTNAAYRDMNPAYFHIAAANILGKLNATFVIDVDAGAEVWNQPVRGFKVFEQTAMSLEEAAQTFYGLAAYPFNSAAKSIVYVKSRLSWIYETYTDGGLVSSGQINQFRYYYYLLELDDAGQIIGGEWVYTSDSDLPDFL